MENHENNREPTEHSRALKLLSGLQIQNVDGVNYLSFAFGCDLVHILKNIVREVPVRPDDIITMGFPRSGNHWTFEIVSMILSQTTNFDKDQFYSRILEFLGKDVATYVEKILSPRNLATHCRIQSIPEEAVDKRVKLIYVLRNPKDVLVSLFKFCCSLSHEGSLFTGSWADFLELQMIGQFPWGYWFDHVLAVEAFQNEHPECPLFVLVYEKLKENPVEEIRKLCTFLDKPDTLAEQIAEMTQFNRMRTELGKTKMSIQSENHFRNGPDDILRKGLVGDWKNWFTVAQNDSFNKLFEAKMGNSKLGALVRQYVM